MLGHSPSEVGMVTPSKCCVNGMFYGGVGSTVIIPGVFSLVTCWCVRGAKLICVGDVGVDDVCVVCVSVDGTWSAMAPNIFADLFKASPWRPWNFLVLFSGFMDFTGECCGYSFFCIHRSFCWHLEMFR